MQGGLAADPRHTAIAHTYTRRADHEIAHNADGSFDVVISEARPPAGDKGARNWLPSQGIRDGLLVIRRYGTLPGQLVECPAFRRRSDGALLKPAHRTYSGSHYAQANGNHRFARLVRVLRVMGLTFLGLLLSPMPLAHVNVAMAIAGMMPVGLNYLLYRVGRRRALAMRDAKTNGSIHKAIEVRVLSVSKHNVWTEPSPSYHTQPNPCLSNPQTQPDDKRRQPKIDFDSASARPHPQHKYFAVSFDTRQGDVVIKGRVLPRQQKYWDLCVYSVYGLPHFHYFTDETVVYTREGSSGDEGHEYEVVLTSCDPSAWVGQPNVVDVSGQPEGVVLVRLIFPASEESFQRSKPTVEVLAPRGGGRKSTGKGE